MLANLPMGGFKITGLAAGVAATDAVNRGQLDSATPVGAVIDFAGSTAPAGWLLCYGQAVSRTTYTALFAVIGTTYGAGDGSTFNLPDARGRVAAGKDNMGGAAASRLTGQSGGVAGTTLGGSGGVETHTLTTAQLASHTHTGTTSASGTHTHNITSANNQNGTGGFGVPNFGGGSGLNKLTDPGGDHTHTFTSDSAGTGAAHNNVQPTIIFNKIIRTGV
jgi:microcystin-dependent protein